jgi:hypothetical protein
MQLGDSGAPVGQETLIFETKRCTMNPSIADLGC